MAIGNTPLRFIWASFRTPVKATPRFPMSYIRGSDVRERQLEEGGY